MQLVPRYETLEILSVSESEFLEIYAESGVPPKWRQSRLIVRLSSESGGGYVQCHRITVERFPTNTTDPVSDELRDLEWSLRP